MGGERGARTGGEPSVEADPGADVQDRRERTQREEDRGGEGDRGRDTAGERDGGRGRRQSDGASGLAERLAAAAERVVREGGEGKRGGHGEGGPERSAGGAGGEREEERGRRQERGEDALGQRGARVARAPATVHERQAQRLAREEGEERGKREADAGGAGCEDEAEDQRLGEQTPAPVLGGEGDGLQRHGGRRRGRNRRGPRVARRRGGSAFARRTVHRSSGGPRVLSPRRQDEKPIHLAAVRSREP